jgi:hypothetical protein
LFTSRSDIKEIDEKRAFGSGSGKLYACDLKEVSKSISRTSAGAGNWAGLQLCRAATETVWNISTTEKVLRLPIPGNSVRVTARSFKQVLLSHMSVCTVCRHKTAVSCDSVS